MSYQIHRVLDGRAIETYFESFPIKDGTIIDAMNQWKKSNKDDDCVVERIFKKKVEYIISHVHA